MRQFDLDEYLKDPSQKVVTRDGRSVRIICTDVLDIKYPIIALVLEDGEEYTRTYKKDGMYNSRGSDSIYDLFFADKEPSYRPYKDAEECFKDVIKHGGWVKNTAGQYLHILAVRDNSMIYADNIPFPNERAYRNWVWADDGTPCGVLEGENEHRRLKLEDGRFVEV